MALKGIRVLTFSPFEMKAFGGFYYETKKKVMWHFTNITSTSTSLLPIFALLYGTIKWAEVRRVARHPAHPPRLARALAVRRGATPSTLRAHVRRSPRAAQGKYEAELLSHRD